MRLPEVPILLPDELLYSWFVRVVLLNSLGRAQVSLAALRGGHLHLAGIDLSTRLSELHARLGCHAPCADALEMVEMATLFPYHRTFLPDSRRATVMKSLLHGPAIGLKQRMGLVANGSGASTILRYCPQCTREDHFQHGTPYWRRAHHLPGVQVCERHGLALVSFAQPSRGPNKHALLLPPRSFTQLAPQLEAGVAHWRFALLSAQALISQKPSSCARRVAIYQRAVIERGFAGARARIDYELLARALLHHHSGFRGFEHRARLVATERTPLAWLRPLLTRPDRAMNPVCHLVLIDFLFGEWHHFQEAVAERETWAAVPPDSVVALGPVQTQALHDVVLNSNISCREAARVTGLCVTTISTRRRAAGLPVQARRKTLCANTLARLRKLIENGHTPAAIAERAGVSLSSVYRFRQEHQEALHKQFVDRYDITRQRQRAVWLDLGRRGLPVKAARACAKGCYAWLYRNDQEWLFAANASFEKAPRSNARVDWAARDREWSTRVDAFACAWRDSHSRGRLSPSAVSRAIGDWTLRGHRDRLPRVMERIEAVTQTQAEFQRTRVCDALVALAQEGLDPTSWRVLKRAGLRKLPGNLDGWPAFDPGPNDPADADSLPADPSTR